MKRSYLLIVLLMLVFTSTAMPTVAQDSDNAPQISALSWSHDSNMIAIGYTQGDIAVISSLDQQIIYKNILDADILEVAWSQDDSQLAIATENNKVLVWKIKDTNIAVEIPSLPSYGYVSSLFWSSDNNLIFIGKNTGNPNFTIWYRGTQQFIHSERLPGIVEFAPNNDYSQLAIGYFMPHINLLDPINFTSTGYVGESLDQLLSQGYVKNGIVHIAWSADNKYIVSGSYEGLVTIWNVDSANEVIQAEGSSTLTKEIDQKYIRDVWFTSTDHTFYSMAGDGTFRAWQTDTGENILDFNLGSNAIQAEVSPDKTKLAYVDENNELHIVTINDLITEQIRLKIDECSPPETLSTTLNTYLDNSDSLGFGGELATLDENALSAECVAQLTAMANLLTEDETE